MPPLELADDGETASEPEQQEPTEWGRSKPTAGTPSATSLGKRKRVGLEEAPLVERVVWTDDSDKEAEQERLKARSKRRSTAKGKQKAKPRRVDSGNRRRDGHRPRALASRVKELGEASEPEDCAESGVPEYLRERRRDFDKGRAKLREAGLRLPPDYSGIQFSDDEGDEDDYLGGGGEGRVGVGGRRNLETRPRFDSSVRPSRAYRDVELEYSAGVVPGCMARYLRDYQIEGVKFLHQLFVYQKGGILGDDMGLGKTVQVAAFLTAAFGKTGDMRDKKRLRKIKRANDGRWYPKVLVVCPGSLIQNWKNELDRWGWWIVELFHGSDKESVLQSAKSGWLEIMVTTYQTYKKNADAINNVEWDAVVADECHCLKDTRAEITKAMNEVNAMCRIGLTGTAIQNKYEELWTLLNWTNPGRFGTFLEWRQTISKPLALGQSHDATLHELSVARKTAKKLVNNLLPDFFLRRMKTLIAHQLPRKSDKVVFCPMTDLQREAYENFLDSEQVRLVRESGDECDCGSGKTRGHCCHVTLGDGRHWRELVFPCIMALQKLANHLTLLIPSTGQMGDRQRSQLETLKTCIPDKWEELYCNRDSLLNLANPEFCGKWKILKKLLRFWHDNGDKVLVFSHSVRLLRILQLLLRNTSYSVSYLDGSLGYEERQQAVDEFNSDPNQFAFLISTKAGGVGLNITSANKVVIFDPHWNPAYDLQAQDRAYRIGQVRDVDVFRLISAGTIEEIVYARQVYKQQQANIGYNASTERRYFKGVQQDKSRKGEIFGLENLFSFHADLVVLRDIVNKTNIAEAKAGVLLSDIDLKEAIKDEGVDGGDDEEVPDPVLVKEEEGGGDDDDDDHDGGMSQLARLITEHHDGGDEEGKSKKDKDNKTKTKTKTKSDKMKKVIASKPKSADAIQAILSSAGVEYTHENSEVVGSSRVEAQLSRRAEMAGDDIAADGVAGRSVLFTDSHANDVADGGDDNDDDDEKIVGGARTTTPRLRLRYNPPAEVMRRQFCTMAREFGFDGGAVEFALVVEGWTQEQRRNCLDEFYRRREAVLLAESAEIVKEKEEGEEEKIRKGEEDEIKVEETAVKAEEGARVKEEGEDTTMDKDIIDLVSVKEEEMSTEDDMPPSPPSDPVPAAAAATTPAPKPEPRVKRESTIFLFDSEDGDDDEL